MLLQLKLSRHAIKRYRERVRPDLDLDACNADIQRRRVEFTGLRRARRKAGTCYLICRTPPAFTLIAQEIPSRVAGQVTYRVMTCVDGTEHY